MTDTGYAFGEFGEQVHGTLRGDVGLPEYVGRVRPDDAGLLSRIHAAGQRHDLDSETRERISQVVDVAAPRLATRAVHQGNDAVVSYLAGVTDRDLDTSPLSALTRMARLVRPQGRLMVLTGGTNGGKTNVGYLAIEVADVVHEGLQVIGNVDSDDFDADWQDRYREVEDFDELREVVESDPDREKFIFVDDASIDHAEGQSTSHEVREQMGEMVRLAAKEHGRIAYLAHREDGKGISKNIRAMPDTMQLHCEAVEADDGTVDEYRAVYREGVGEEADDLRTLGQLPETRVDYDPDAKAHRLFR